MKHIFSINACVCVYPLIMVINRHILLFHTNMKIWFYNFPNSITRRKKLKKIDVYRFRFSCTCDLQWEDDWKHETYHSGKHDNLRKYKPSWNNDAKISVCHNLQEVTISTCEGWRTSQCFHRFCRRSFYFSTIFSKLFVTYLMCKLWEHANSSSFTVIL